MKCGCKNCNEEATYDASLEYNTASGMRVNHLNYCDYHMNSILTELLAYKSRFNLKIHSIIRLDNAFYKSLPDCYKGKECHEKEKQ